MSAPAVSAAVTAANDLTARWCAAQDSREFVLSGAGLWPLLALLSDAAEGPARAELSAATGRPASAGRDDALDLLRALSGGATSAALGVWVRRDLPLHQEWVASLPAGVVEHLLGQAQLDAWANQHTRGMIERFPLQVRPRDVLVLATALAAKTAWLDPFTPGKTLTRSTTDLDQASTLASGVTRVVVEGSDGLDVHLLLGPDALRVGVDALAGRVAAGPVDASSPGVTVRESHGAHDTLRVSVPPFTLRTSHDLCAHADLFGLRAAMDASHGHFPAISPKPLAISQGAQDVYAQFSATGFEAAAVTAIGVRLAGAFRTPRDRIRLVEVRFEAPFGFLAVDRASGLVVVAGRVAP